MRLRKHYSLSFILAFVIAVQPVVMARASLTEHVNDRDLYGGIICSARNSRADIPFKDPTTYTCCVNGCVFSIAFRISHPDIIFLKLSERASESLAVVRVLSLLSQKNSLVYDARSPPVALP